MLRYDVHSLLKNTNDAFLYDVGFCRQPYKILENVGVLYIQEGERY